MNIIKTKSHSINNSRLSDKVNSLLFNNTSWVLVVAFALSIFAVAFRPHASATMSGQTKYYFHKEASDANETFNNLGLPSAEINSYTTSTVTSTTNVTGPPPTAMCESSDNTADKYNAIGASAASTGNRCIATFISAPVGQAITVTSGESAFSTQLYASESANATTVNQVNAYVYRWNGSGTTLGTVGSSDRIATLTGCTTDVNTTATSCTATATAAATVNIAATDRIVVVISINISAGSGNGRSVAAYFDNFNQTGGASAAPNLIMNYTTAGSLASNKPSLTGAMDDDFTTNQSPLLCAGQTYNSKWNCLAPAATNSSSFINAGGLTSPTGDASSWLNISNTNSSTTTLSEFGSTPSNAFFYQNMPTSYGNGSITTAVNNTGFFDACNAGASSCTATNSVSPFSHSGLALWTSSGASPDYLEIQVYANGVTTGTNTVNVALNNSGTLSGVTSLNPTTTSGAYNNIWLRFTNTAGSWQAQYSTDGTSFTNVGSPVTHSYFSRVGLNIFDGIGNLSSITYSGSFDWFSYGLANPNYNQTSFEFFDNADSTTPGTAHGNNTNYTLTSSGQAFRLRQLLKTNGNINGTLPSNSFSVNPIFTPVNISYEDMALDSNNKPYLAYIDNGSLLFTRCTIADCSSHSSAVTVVSAAFQNPHIAMGSDGFARISFYDQLNRNLKFVQCTNADCSTHSTPVTVDSTLDTGQENYLAMGSDGFARIGYWDINNSSLEFARCTNADCSAHSTPVVVDNSNDDGRGVSLALGSDGFARISYYDNAAGVYTIRLVQCTNADCSTHSTPVTAESTDLTFSGNSRIALGSDGFARIAYYDGTNTHPKFVQCTNADCSTHSTPVTVDNGTLTGGDLSFSLGSDGLARMAYDDGNFHRIKFVQCTNADCSSTNTPIAVSSGETQAILTSLKIGSDGFARIVFDGTDIIKLARQNSPFKLQFGQGPTCSSASYNDISTSSSISYNDNPTPSDNAAITYQSGIDPTDSGQTVAAQNYIEGGMVYNTTSFGSTVDAEWDFALKDNGASGGTPYCFRLAQGDGTVLSTYTNYPVITTAGVSGPTTDQVLRGGQWFNSGTKQPFFWAQ